MHQNEIEQLATVKPDADLQGLLERSGGRNGTDLLSKLNALFHSLCLQFKLYMQDFCDSLHCYT